MSLVRRNFIICNRIIFEGIALIIDHNNVGSNGGGICYQCGGNYEVWFRANDILNYLGCDLTQFRNLVPSIYRAQWYELRDVALQPDWNAETEMISDIGINSLFECAQNVRYLNQFKIWLRQTFPRKSIDPTITHVVPISETDVTLQSSETQIAVLTERIIGMERLLLEKDKMVWQLEGLLNKKESLEKKESV